MHCSGWTVDGSWSEWSSWGSCSCETGTIKRERHCSNPQPFCHGEWVKYFYRLSALFINNNHITHETSSSEKFKTLTHSSPKTRRPQDLEFPRPNRITQNSQLGQVFYWWSVLYVSKSYPTLRPQDSMEVWPQNKKFKAQKYPSPRSRRLHDPKCIPRDSLEYK